MDQAASSALSAWVTEAGLVGRSESDLMAGFCRQGLRSYFARRFHRRFPAAPGGRKGRMQSAA
ncbi:MAG TPA: hypothetical protein VGF07_14670 [Stellaceae bacterium]|jgi:hypothetical protein